MVLHQHVEARVPVIVLTNDADVVEGLAIVAFLDNLVVRSTRWLACLRVLNAIRPHHISTSEMDKELVICCLEVIVWVLQERLDIRYEHTPAHSDVSEAFGLR